MFGSSRKQVIFNPTVYGNNRRSRRMPRWLITFLAGVITGGGGFWFLQTNYGPPRISMEEANRLQSTITDLTQEREAVEQKLAESQLALSQAHDLIKQLQPVIASPDANNNPAGASLNPITPIQENANQANMAELLKNLPPDPNNTPVEIRVGNFTGSIGKLGYELILTKSDPKTPNTSARVEILTRGVYRNGNKGFEQLQSINITANEFVRLQGQVSLSKSTLTPQTVEIKVVDTQTRKVLGSRSFEVKPEQAPAN